MSDLDREAQGPELAPQAPDREGAAQETAAVGAVPAGLSNQVLARLARPEGLDAPRPRVDPHARFLSHGLQLARREHRPESATLLRALRMAEDRPVDNPLLREAAPASDRCACGGNILPGGECSKCMASRLARQGMPAAEVQRVVLARSVLAREGPNRSYLQCVNYAFSNAGIPWAVLAILGGVCGLLGAAGGSAAAPGPGTAAGGVSAAALCVAGVTGMTFGFCFGVLTNCARDPNGDWVFASNDTGGGDAGAGGGADAAGTATA